MKIISFAAAVLAGTVQASTDGKCRALVLSGGGTNGAWEAGVIWGLTHYGNPVDFEWDVHSGISAGSINTVGQVGFDPTQTVEASEFLSDSWANQTNANVYQLWQGHGLTGFVFSCLENISCVNDDPGLEWLRGALTKFTEAKRRFTVGAVDVQTGDFVTFTQDNTAFEDIPQAALASSSIPGFFPPQHLHGHVLMDGGTVWNVNAASAITQCLDLVENEADIIVDIVICGTPSAHEETDISKNAYQVYKRGKSIKDSMSGPDSIAETMKAFPDVDYRYLIMEGLRLGGPSEIDFRNETTWPFQMEGRQDANETLQAQMRGFNGFLALKDWKENVDKVRSNHETFYDYFQKLIQKAIGS